MLSLNQIETYYPALLRVFKKNILREYLQYKILEIIFNSQFTHQLSFIGGTALRIIYDNARFSEDLDFDNFGLSRDAFSLLAKEIEKDLQKQGYEVEMKNVFKDAYRCYVRLPKVLFDNELSDIKEEKILIQVDTAAHNFRYQPDNKILNKFDVFTQIHVTPLDIILSQKIYAALNRKRPKGRDFFDIIFLLGKTKPNYQYLKQKIAVTDAKSLKRRFSQYLQNVNLSDISKDVEPFLIQPSESKKIQLFYEYIQQAQL